MDTQTDYATASGPTGRSLNEVGKNLIRLGVNEQDAYAWSRTRKGGWAVAQSPIMITTVTFEKLKQRGYIAMLDYYTCIPAT
jgi:hypothetical protein